MLASLYRMGWWMKNSYPDQSTDYWYCGVWDRLPASGKVIPLHFLEVPAGFVLGKAMGGE